MRSDWNELDWNGKVGSLSPQSRDFVKDLLDTFAIFETNHERPETLRLTGKFVDGCRIDLSKGYGKK